MADKIRDYDEQLVSENLSPMAAKPPENFNAFMSTVASPVNFSEDEAGELEYLEGYGRFKQNMGANLAATGAAALTDPEEAYKAAVLNNSAYQPRFNYDARNDFGAYLEANAPQAFNQYQQQQAEEQASKQRGLGPASEGIRQGLITQEGKQEFDRRADAEMLDRVLPPPQMDRLGEQSPMPAPSRIGLAVPAPPQDVPQTNPLPAETPEAPAASREIVYGPGSSRTFRESGLTEDEFYKQRDQNELKKVGALVGADTTTPEGKQKASEFQRALDEQGISRLRFTGQQNKILRDPAKAKEYKKLSDSEKVSFVKLQDSLEKISGRTDRFGRRTRTNRRGNEETYLTEEGARMEALRSIDKGIQAGEFTYDDLAQFNVLSPENEREALNKRGYDAMVLSKEKENEFGEPKVITLTRPDGSNVDMLSYGKGRFSQLPKREGEKEKAEDLKLGGYNTPGPELLVIMPDGKSKTYDKRSHWLGSDGIVREREAKWGEDVVGEKLFLGYAPPKPPKGVTDVTFGEGKTATEAEPPMEGAKKAPDGKWYVQKNGTWNEVVQ